ncbi:hypothetical protein HKX48_002516 [Thoreauomyces humboldtii]|nr:hypothetical protein HKX48_002516 [Thoreauomyces humboldtii]
MMVTNASMPDHFPQVASSLGPSSRACPQGSLPADLILDILKNTSPLDAARWGRSSRPWNQLCADNLLWKHFALRRWKHWKELPTGSEWLEAFRDKYRKDRVVQTCLDSVVRYPAGRIRNLVTISELQVDALDALAANEQHRGPDNLSRRYHVRKAEALVNRRWVASQWLHLCPESQPYFSILPSALPQRTFTLEYGAWLICKFTNRALKFEDLTAQLDELAEEAIAGGHVAPVDHPAPAHGSSIEIRARQLYTFLFEFKGFCGAADSFYDVKNSLLKDVLERRIGIPITLTLVYHAVGLRLGIHVDMIGFPAHFLGKITTEGGVDWFIDCFRSGQEVPGGFKTRQQCEEILARHRLPPREEFFEPSGAREIFTRMASNIIGIANQPPAERASQTLGVHAYGSCMLLLLLGPVHNPRRRFLYGSLSSDYPEDVWFAESDLATLRALAQDNAERTLDLRLLSNEIAGLWAGDGERPVPAVKDRNDPNLTPRPAYVVGTIIRHTKYDFYAVIYDWDRTFEGNEGWFALQANQEAMRDGRVQPFYSVLSLHPSGGTTPRYVAEEFIALPPAAELQSVATKLRRRVNIGRWFDRWDKQNGRFVLVQEKRNVYING